MVTALRRKLLRDLRSHRGQVITVALVVAAGVAVFIGFQSVFQSLVDARDAYYERYRFADLSASLERAPDSERARLEDLPGVSQVETRVTGPLRVQVPGAVQPPWGLAVSLPDEGRPLINDIHLRSGRLPRAGRNEVLVLARFAERYDVTAGATLAVVLDGTAQRLRVVGTAMSPEFVYPVGAGEVIGDESRFAALWMRRSDLSAMLGLAGAFNDVLVRLQPGASPREVRAGLDARLEPHGGRGAVERAHQPSNAILEGELDQLQGMANTLPFIFLFVAAFLLNVVLSRMVHLQRAQIAALKAVGYSNRAVGQHYLEWVALIVLLGSALGVALGAWLGKGMHGLYQPFFQFPAHRFELVPSVVAESLLIGAGAAVAGGAIAVRAVVRLPPAEAMRPAAPPNYRRSLLDVLGFGRLLPASVRMVTRELGRRPLRTFLSVLGVGLGCGVLVLGRFNQDAIDALMHTLFEDLWREDLSVTLSSPVTPDVLRSVGQLPGVERVEGLRVLPVRLRAGPRERDVTVHAYPDGMGLRGPRDLDGRQVPLPRSGLLLTRQLGTLLDLRPGEEVLLEPREGARRPVRVTVAGLLDEVSGLQGHLRLSTLSALLGEEPTVSLALLQVTPGHEEDVVAALQELPAVVNVTSRKAMVAHVRGQTAESMRVVTLFATFFAVVLAVGVVYNNARVSLSMRERELASMRVLGFTRREVSAVLLGELGGQVLAALPLGFWLGHWMSRLVAESASPERFRFPFGVSRQTYAFAAAVTLAAGLFSALLVRRRLQRLDLIGVLKSRE